MDVCILTKCFCNIFLLFFLISTVFGQDLEENDRCTLKTGHAGVCKLFRDCPDAIASIKTNGFHKLKRCGFQGFDEVTCCAVEDSMTTKNGGESGQNNTFQGSENKNGQNSGLDNTFDLDDAQPKWENASEVWKRPAARACDRIVLNSVPPLADHIIGGIESSLGEFPHMAALGYPRKEKYAFLCGGTLISDRFIITAAHCVGMKSRDPDRTTIPTIVRLGTVEVEDGKSNSSLDYNISRIIVHPEYRQFLNDIGLVKVSEPVSFSATVHPACLAVTPDVPHRLTITGWGVVNYETRKRESVLQKASINSVEQGVCVEMYKPYKLGITDKMICAASGEGKDACQGDSGGPLQALSENDAHYRIIGIVSFGHGCGSKTPGVYTRVYSYLDWVESVVWEEGDLKMEQRRHL